MNIDKKYVERICRCISFMAGTADSKIYLLRLYARGRSKEEIDFIESSIKSASIITYYPDEPIEELELR